MLPVAAVGLHPRLWFDIERWVDALHRICAEVRASEQLNRRRLADGAGVAMLEERLGAGAASSSGAGLAAGGALLTQRPAGALADVVVAREELRRLLGFLKARLADELTEREVYHLLFPLVIYTDELLNEATDGGVTRWEPLQGELYDVDNGGELFFSTVDMLLHKDDTHPLIFEVYYFCLSDGFLGEHHGHPGKIQEYRRRIAERIPVEASPPSVTGRERPVRLERFPLRTYLFSAGAVVVVCLLFAYWARSAVEESRVVFAQGVNAELAADDDEEGGVRNED